MTRPPKIPESVLVVIHTADAQVLLIERADKPGFWQSVTGSKDSLDEPIVGVAWRELAEETGITTGQLPHWRHRYAPGVTHNTEHVFGLTVPAGVPVTLNPREHLRHQWLPWREAAERCFSPSNAEAIRLLPGRLGIE